MERGLLEWYCKLGLKEADRYVEQAMHYGTLMHLTFGDYLVTKKFDLETIPDIIKDFCEKKNYWADEVKDWPTRLRDDMLAFAQFVFDCNVVPIGIEFVLVSNRGFGTLIDLVCEMDYTVKGFNGEKYKSGPRKGEPKETITTTRKIAIVNFKSGRHGFGRANGLQVEAERILFEENFPDIKIAMAFNWSPKEWKTTPGYNLKDWVGDISQEEITAILTLAQLRFGNRAMNKEYMKVEGTLTLEAESMDKVLRFVTAEEYAKEKYGSIPTS
jgi:hypothetical protein